MPTSYKLITTYTAPMVLERSPSTAPRSVRIDQVKGWQLSPGIESVYDFEVIDVYMLSVCGKGKIRRHEWFNLICVNIGCPDQTRHLKCSSWN